MKSDVVFRENPMNEKSGEENTRGGRRRKIFFCAHSISSNEFKCAHLWAVFVRHESNKKQSFFKNRSSESSSSDEYQVENEIK